MSATPRMRELTEKLWPHIGQFLKENAPATDIDVNSYLERQKRENPDEFRDVVFRRRGFTARGCAQSNQVDYAMANLIASGRITETGKGVELTSYGGQLISQLPQ